MNKKHDNSKNIFEIEENILPIMQDIRNKLGDFYDKDFNKSREVSLPDFDDIVKNKKLLYDTTRYLIEYVEDIINLKVKINIVYRYIMEIKNIKVSTQKDYTMITNFKKTLKLYEEELTNYKIELTEIIKNVNSKIRLLESVNFISE